MPPRLRARACLAPVLGFALVAACSRSLPDPESPGAQLYQARCASGCHRLYNPGSMTSAMWEIQVDRMQQELARGGLAPFSEQERRLVLRYLRAYSSDAAGNAR
jgi:hypothetical protein